MPREYSIDVCRELEGRFQAAGLHRPMRIRRYNAGTELVYDVTGVAGGNKARVHLAVERFVGGGFAGQVYQVKVLGIDADSGPIDGLEAGGVYAMKILIPLSGFSRLFRNLLYFIGFQGPFQLQVNPTAARAGALWQKFIRRAAKTRFGKEDTVVDIHATFVDENLGSCGELSEWVYGRTWWLEVDDRLDLLRRWRRGKVTDEALIGELGLPEYRAKREFMHRFVELLHDVGGYEFARQYEWSTCKSQPNCLKRQGTEKNPSAGLVAVDFRAGLALLPFLPMSPGDFKLIAKGLARGSLVQFDRGSISKLEAFVQDHSEQFADMDQMLEELKATERVYRDSVPDITHNHIRLLYSPKLWSTMLTSAVTSWRVRNITDEVHAERLQRLRILAIPFALLGMLRVIGLSAAVVGIFAGIGVSLSALFGYRSEWLVPVGTLAASAFIGGVVLSTASQLIRRLWGRADWRRHYWGMLSSWGYLQRAAQGRIAEKVIVWHRAGRVDERRALRIASDIREFLSHLPLSVLPAGLHRFLTDGQYAKERLAYFFVRPVRLYFNAELREQWLREMVTEGREKHMLSSEDANVILSQVNEPFIQKYLKSLAVHVCTLPVTQVVSVLVAVIYVLTHPEMPRAQAWGIGAGIIVSFQLTPISPGSLVRGLYVLYLVIREWNLKDYNIAVFLGFFKYIGYLAFPIQMTYHYPTLARFMSAHWATEAAHVVPVFGERGALLEHWAFCLFYNWPLTIRRRMRNRAKLRASMKPRYWHVGLCSIAAAGVFGLADFAYLRRTGELPALKDIWWLAVAVPLVCGVAVTLGCGGAGLSKRIVAAASCGAVVGILCTAVSAVLSHSGGVVAEGIVAGCVWRIFIFAVLSTIGAIATELKLPDPDLA
jgi:hypothetical protein